MVITAAFFDANNCRSSSPKGANVASDREGNTIWDHFQKVAKKHPNRDAIVVGTDARLVVTYGQLNRAAEEVADALPNESPRTAVLLFHRAEIIDFTASLLGCLKADVNAVLLGPDQSWPEIQSLVGDQGRLVLMCSHEPPQARQSAHMMASRSMQLTETVISIDASDGSRCQDSSLARTVHEMTGPTVSFTTSGTTGTPKIVTHTQTGLLSSVDMVDTGFNALLGLSLERSIAGLTMAMRRPRAIYRGLIGPRIWMTPLPVWRIAGNTLVLQALLTGGTFVAPLSDKADHIRRLLARERVSVFATAPLGCELLIRNVERRPGHFPHLLVVGLGSDRAPAQLLERARRVLGCFVVSGYGSTELAGGVSTTHPLDPPPSADGCVGRPFPGAAFKIVDDAGSEVARGVEGRLLCRIAQGRVGRRAMADTAGGEPHVQTGDSADDLFWYETGDVGKIGADGNLYILARSDDVIVKSGKNIDPHPIEDALRTISCVRDVAVVGTPGKNGNTQVVAIVVGKPGYFDLLETIGERLPKVTGSTTIDLLVEVASVPRNDEGAIRRSKIRSDMATRMTDGKLSFDSWIMGTRRPGRSAKTRAAGGTSAE